MKKYEIESFLKSFILFFSTLLILNAVIFWFYYEEQKRVLQEDIFNKIKIYNYTFKDKDITIKLVPIRKKSDLYALHITDGDIFAYFDIPTSKKSSLKIIYSYKIYKSNLYKLLEKNLLYFFISSLVLLFLSIIYSLYAIKPLKNALYLLDEFLKDIIHDLNTPVSSILLNLRILKKKKSEDAIQRIEFSTKKIGSLYNNLESMIKEKPLHVESVDISSMLNEKIEYFSYLYPDITFETDIKNKFLKTSQDEFSRILDNLISNACKYNKPNGKISIYIDEKVVKIEDTGIGIRNCSKVFDRFYKEGDRGMGLGLDIVKKMCNNLGYGIQIKSKLDIGTKVEITL